MTTDAHPNTRPTSTGRRPNDLTDRTHAVACKGILLDTTLPHANWWWARSPPPTAVQRLLAVPVDQAPTTAASA